MVTELAPAKVNLVLQVGRRRDDGLHEIASLFASLDLADELDVEPSDGPGDEVVCPRVPGENLVSAALAAFRAGAGAELPPLRVTIEKRIPVAAGLGGGSADAAAALRAANAIAGHPLDADALRAIGARIGADVPSQVVPRHALVTGAGEGVEPLDLPDMHLVLVPAEEGLSTAAVYAEADRIPSTRPQLDPDALRRLAGAPLAALARSLENDLEPAALSLRPELTATLTALNEAGALAARITGSGPTAFGVFESERAAGAAAALLSDAIVTPLRHSPR
jgi:4-diphosphocytidyl-2-C-methyl-D-erythritol kinase